MSTRNLSTFTNDNYSSSSEDTKTVQTIIGFSILNGAVGLIATLLFVWTIYKIRRMRTQINLLLTNMAFADILMLIFFNFQQPYSKNSLFTSRTPKIACSPAHTFQREKRKCGLVNRLLQRGVIKNDLFCRFVGYVSEVSSQSSLILLIVITTQCFVSISKIRPVAKLDPEPNLI